MRRIQRGDNKWGELAWLQTAGDQYSGDTEHYWVEEEGVTAPTAGLGVDHLVEERAIYGGSPEGGIQDGAPSSAPQGRTPPSPPGTECGLPSVWSPADPISNMLGCPLSPAPEAVLLGGPH